MQRQIIQDIGWYGVMAILLAYTLVNFGAVSPHSGWYLGLNLSGSIAIVIVAASKKDRQPMVLNLVWALIAVVAIIRLWVT